jgi:hypothetical protein
VDCPRASRRARRGPPRERWSGGGRPGVPARGPAQRAGRPGPRRSSVRRWRSSALQLGSRQRSPYSQGLTTGRRHARARRARSPQAAWPRGGTGRPRRPGRLPRARLLEALAAPRTGRPRPRAPRAGRGGDVPRALARAGMARIWSRRGTTAEPLPGTGAPAAPRCRATEPRLRRGPVSQRPAIQLGRGACSPVGPRSGSSPPINACVHW